MVVIKQFSIAIFLSGIFATDQCEYESCTKTIDNVTATYQHSGCLAAADAYCPGRVEQADMSDICIDRILQLHNDCRQRAANGTWSEYLGPGIVTDMKPVKWNPEIAKVAQAWANQCKYEHDSCRNMPTANDWCGQNLYIRTRDQDYIYCSEVFTYAMKGWCDKEVVLITPNIVENYVFDDKYGHFTEIVWNYEENMEIGCGYSKFYYDQWERDVVLVVCNYCPGGNIRNEKMFSQELINITEVEEIVLDVLK